MWGAPLCRRTLFWERVPYTTVIEAPTRSMVSTMPLGWWQRGSHMTARGPSSWQARLVRMAWCEEGSKSCRWFQMRLLVLVLVGMPVWWSIQRRHVLRARCAAWSLIVATLPTSGQWFAGHAMEKERGVSRVGCLHLVPYGVTITGPCCTDGSGGYGGGPAPVCRPCLGDGVCGCLEGGGGSCWVECLEALPGVQDPREVVRQALV